MKFILASVLLLLIASSLACFYSHDDFSPSGSAKEFLLFYNYRLTFEDILGMQRLKIELDYAGVQPDAQTLERVPICVVDSVTIRNLQLEKQECFMPKSWYEEDQDSYRKGYGKDRSHELVRDKDIYRVEGRLVPGGYTIFGADEMLYGSTKGKFTLTIFARLLDRATSATLDATELEILFQSKPYHRLEME